MLYLFFLLCFLCVVSCPVCMIAWITSPAWIKWNGRKMRHKSSGMEPASLSAGALIRRLLAHLLWHSTRTYSRTASDVNGLRKAMHVQLYGLTVSAKQSAGYNSTPHASHISPCFHTWYAPTSLNWEWKRRRHFFEVWTSILNVNNDRIKMLLHETFICPSYLQIVLRLVYNTTQNSL